VRCDQIFHEKEEQQLFGWVKSHLINKFPLVSFPMPLLCHSYAIPSILMPLSANPESFRPTALGECPDASARVLPPALSTFPSQKATPGENTMLDGEGAGWCCS
jgi:hypothetical protein